MICSTENFRLVRSGNILQRWDGMTTYDRRASHGAQGHLVAGQHKARNSCRSQRMPGLGSGDSTGPSAGPHFKAISDAQFFFGL